MSIEVKDVLDQIDNLDDHLATQFEAEVNGYEFSLEKDGESEDWYIQVKPVGESFLYDGWWSDSEDKELAEAIAEAIEGSMLNEPKPLTKEQIYFQQFAD